MAKTIEIKRRKNPNEINLIHFINGFRVHDLVHNVLSVLKQNIMSLITFNIIRVNMIYFEAKLR